MKKVLVLAAFVIIFSVLDNGLMPFLAIRGHYASLTLVFCISYSIINGSWEGLWLGAIAGLMQDIYFGVPMGINALTTMLVCVIAGEIGNNLFKEKALIPVVSCLILSILKGIMVVGILAVVGQTSSIEGVLYRGVYSAVICIFMYKKIFKLCQKSYMVKRWRF